MKTNKTITRKDEIRYTTADPKQMLGKFICEKVYHRYSEDHLLENGEVVSLDRSELLFDSNTYIDQDVLARIRFFLQTGELKEIEVSNQNRRAFVLPNTALFLYKAAAQILDKKHTFLLYATSVKNAHTILTDYIELNYNGGFDILEIKYLDTIMVLIDNLDLSAERHKLDKAYLKDEIDTEEYANVEVEGAGTGDDNTESVKQNFYQIVARIVRTKGKDNENPRQESNYTFIVKTVNATRANTLIEDYLRKHQEEESRKHPDHIKYDIHSFIEECKTIPIGSFVPVEFSQVYQDE